MSDNGTTDPGRDPVFAAKTGRNELEEVLPVSELEQLRAERARLVESREQRTAARAAADEIERMKRGIADEQAIAKAECEIGPLGRDIGVVYSQWSGVVIVKRPSHASYRRMIDAVAADKITRTVINEKFAFECLVHPDKLGLERVFKDEPGLIEHVAGVAAKLAGLVAEEMQGK